MCSCITAKDDDEISYIMRSGLHPNHAYGVLEAREVQDKNGQSRQLVKLRNPWGQTSWKGAWSEYSDEWTPELEQLLKPEAADGVLWMDW